MTEDDAELISRLTTRAGMIMEDASMLAITIMPQSGAARATALIRLSQAAQTISALVDAAVALNGHIESDWSA